MLGDYLHVLFSTGKIHVCFLLGKYMYVSYWENASMYVFCGEIIYMCCFLVREHLHVCFLLGEYLYVCFFVLFFAWRVLMCIVF